MYTLHQEQDLQVSPEKFWKFLSSPRNINDLTPPDLKFDIISELPEEMFEGQLIEYQIKMPLIGRRPWVAEIKHIIPGRRFVDEQRVGPYAFWYHVHELKPLDNGGVCSIDHVTYLPPLGPFGKIANRLFIARQLQEIFRFRKAALAELFNE